MPAIADAETPLIIILSSVSLLGVAIAYIRRQLALRDDRGRAAVGAQYSVPTGYNLLEAGDLVDRSATAVAAEIVSLAVRGKLRILDFPVSGGRGGYTLQLLNSKGVDAQERQLLEALFPGLAVGGVRELGVVDRTLALVLRACPSAARTSVTARGWRSPVVAPVGKQIALAMAVVLVPTLVFFGVVVLSGGSGQLGKVIPFVFIAAICVYLANRFAAATLDLTEPGAEQRDHLKGIKVYLGLAEDERLRMSSSPGSAVDTVKLVKRYEKLLPFAVLWGVERDWARELVALYEQGAPTPDWLMSKDGFNANAFGAAVGGLVASVAKSTDAPGGSGGR